MTNLKKAAFAAFLLGTGSFLLSSCDHPDGQGIPVQNKSGKNNDVEKKALASVSSQAVPVGGTTVIMYPLALRTQNKADEGFKRYSSDSDSGPYWNIAFYDLKTGNSNLLDSGRAILINSFQKLKTLIIYKVTITDYNSNDKLDDTDPVYLFTSDLNGKSFKQITPNDIDAKSFQVINGTEIILIQAIKDSTKDKKFGNDDEVIPMIFDATKATAAKHVFSTPFNKKVSQEFNKLYKN